MTKKLKPLTNEEWLDDFSGYVGRETQKLLKGYAESHSQPAEHLVSRYVRYLLTATVTEILRRHEKELETKGQQQVYQETYNEYKNFKHRLETDVADAFSTAMKEFSKNGPDFYCEIAVMPEPINREPA